MPRTRPNILIFMTDQQQGATALPEHPCRTPNLDRFAAQSVTFANTYCPAPHCCPSRASFVSGLYPARHGIYNNVNTDTAINANLNPGITLFSEELRDAGYRLAYAGKWHVARDEGPQDRGWESLGAAPAKGVADGRRDPAMWKDALAELQSPRPRRRGELLRPGWGNRLLYGSVPAKGPKGYEETGDHRIVERGLAGLRDLTAGEEPWCLYIGVNGPHDVYVVPEPFARLHDPESVELPPSFADTLADKPRIYQRMRHQYWGQLSEAEIRECIAHYYGYCTMEDALFGLVLEALEATGQADDTVVLYMSDHGDYVGAHGLWCKGVPSFREAYHVPALVRWPKVGVAGRRVEALVSMMDFAPTFLELAGVKPREEHYGRSLLPWVRGETPRDWRDAMFLMCNGVELYYTQRTVFTRDYKYVFNGFDFDELYDLRKDPHELVNLAFPDLSRLPRPHSNGGLSGPEGFLPWPPLTPELEQVRRDLLRRLWEHARQQQDMIFNPYFTVAMAPIGPAVMMDE